MVVVDDVDVDEGDDDDNVNDVVTPSVINKGRGIFSLK